jgi:hypothetical protein
MAVFSAVADGVPPVGVDLRVRQLAEAAQGEPLTAPV